MNSAKDVIKAAKAQGKTTIRLNAPKADLNKEAVRIILSEAPLLTQDTMSKDRCTMLVNTQHPEFGVQPLHYTSAGWHVGTGSNCHILCPSEFKFYSVVSDLSVRWDHIAYMISESI